MKRIILVIALTTIAFLTANAQGKIYCEIVGTQKLLSTKVTVQVDFGQQTRFSSDNRLVDEKGNVIVFNSMVDAMNYMGSLGWEFEQAYVVTIGGGGSASNVYHWLLSKFVDEGGDSNTLKTKDIIFKERRESKKVQQTESQETESQETE